MIKILIVDDKEEGCYLLETLLKGYGYEVASAQNGAEAIEKLRADGFGMVISDILMPVTDGFQLCREVRSEPKLKIIPFVFYSTSYTDEKDEELAFKLGADRFIRKPVEPDEFIKVIKDVIKEAEKGKIKPKPPIAEEEEILKLHSEVLIRQLQKKMLDLEREIIQRRRTEEALRKSEEKYLTLVERSNDGIVVIQDGLIKFANSIMAKMGDFTLDEILEKPFIDFIVPDYRQSTMDVYKKRMLGEKVPDRYEIELIAKDGKQIPVEVNATTIEYEGRPAVMVVARDISERKQAEEKLQQSYEKLRKALEATIQTIVTIAEMRDPYTAGHQRRVTKLATAIAEELGFSKERIEAIHVAGLLHDIGKVYVPAEILSKPGRLNEQEMGLIKAHPQTGREILKAIEFPWPICQFVVQHHERLNGSGYPSGLSGEDIVLEARILAVADVVEAMASHRPYRPAIGIDKALEEIMQNKGILYDPQVAEACVRLFREKGFTFD